MAQDIVIDIDWFKDGKTRLIKQLAFAGPTGSQLFVFTFPDTLNHLAEEFNRQARHSHGLIWNTTGNIETLDVTIALERMFEYLGTRPSNCVFWTKGLEKKKLLETFLPEVRNLEDIGCPKFSDLTGLPQSTLSKAQLFRFWLDGQDHKRCIYCKSQLRA